MLQRVCKRRKKRVIFVEEESLRVNVLLKGERLNEMVVKSKLILCIMFQNNC